MNDLWDEIHELAAELHPSADSFPRIRFKGAEYRLIGDLERGGAIATKEQYENGRCSYAHLFPDGKVMRFHEVIGNVSDIEVLS